jgi:hypothetical protein
MFQQKIETTDLWSGVWVWVLGLGAFRIRIQDYKISLAVNTERIKPHIKWLANCERVQASIKLSPMFLSPACCCQLEDSRPRPSIKTVPNLRMQQCAQNHP